MGQLCRIMTGTSHFKVRRTWSLLDLDVPFSILPSDKAVCPLQWPIRCCCPNGRDKLDGRVPGFMSIHLCLQLGIKLLKCATCVIQNEIIT